MKKSRSLELFFVDGDPEGMLTATVPFQWTGHVLVASRTQLRDALKREESSRPGVYLLVGEDEHGALLYIGESDDIGTRIKNHDAKKEWWSTAILITSSGEQLNKAHARYLEVKLIEQAQSVNKIRLDNNTNPSIPALSEAAKAHMLDFLENIYLVLPALRFDFFIENTRTLPPVSEAPLDSPVFEMHTPKHGLTATARIVDSRFVVEAGSLARMSWKSEGREHTTYGKLFHELVDQHILIEHGKHRIFTRSYAFASPSAAAAVINGRPTNGTTAWKIKGTNTTYKEWEQSTITALAPS